MSEADERLIYRVAQEALRNAVTHAAPCAVTISLAHEGGRVELVVADDGPGFDARAALDAPVEGHLGLRVLHDLATDAGAELALATTPGRGTRWRLRLSDTPRETP